MMGECRAKVLSRFAHRRARGVLMGRPMQVEYEGRTLDGEDLSFETLKDSYSEYRTEDGTVLRLKTVVAHIVRTKEYTPTGDPLYIVRHSVLVSSMIPPDLKRKPHSENRHAEE